MKTKPPRLRKGHEIGIIAPAGPVTPFELQPAIDFLAAKGYHVTLSPHLYHREGYLAGGDDARLEDFHSMFADDNVKAVFCARGGYGTLRLLERIDYDLIRRNPKVFVGYSDITALLLAIYKKTGLITFHGPMVKELSRGSNRTQRILLNTVSSIEYPELDLSGGTVLISGQAKGTLLGGNLSLISSLIGTSFMPKLKEAILFIEERGEPLYRVDRMLTHLRLSGFLKDLAGLILGRFVDCGGIEAVNRLLMESVSELNIPVYSGLPVGHEKENITLPLGLQANLDTGLMRLTILESPVTT